MKLSFILLLLCVSMHVVAQTFGEINTSGIDKQSKIERNLDKQISKGLKNKSISSSSKTQKGDTLTYIVQAETDPFTLKLIFNVYDSTFNEKYCGWQEYIFDCSPCGQKHLAQMKQYSGFIQNSDSTFLSEPYLQTEMKLVYRNGNKDCLTVQFKHVDMPYKEYKEAYRELKKKKDAKPH